MASRHSAPRSEDEERLQLELALQMSLTDGRPAAPPHVPPGPPSPSASPAASQQPPPQPRPQPQPSPQPRPQGGLLGSLRGLLQGAADGLAGAGGPLASCGGCGHAVGLGRHLDALGRTYHPQCFVCAGCGAPVGEPRFAVGADGRPYHAACHRALHHPDCRVCGAKVPQRADGRVEWRETPFWRDRWCPEHASDGTPSCCGCGRLARRAGGAGGEGASAALSDGRRLCLDCLGTAVVDTADAQPLYDAVLADFARQGLAHRYRAPLVLVERGVLDSYARGEGRPSAAGAPATHVLGLCVATVHTSVSTVVRGAVSALLTGSARASTLTPSSCEVKCVLVVHALPRLLAGSVIAHEAMHAYLRQRHVSGLDAHVEEGLCQLLAYMWLDAQAAACRGFDERLCAYLAHAIRRDTSYEYGDGFRAAHALFQMRGLRALVEHVVAHGAFPDWAE